MPADPHYCEPHELEYEGTYCPYCYHKNKPPLHTCFGFPEERDLRNLDRITLEAMQCVYRKRLKITTKKEIAEYATLALAIIPILTIPVGIFGLHRHSRREDQYSESAKLLRSLGILDSNCNTFPQNQ